MKAVCIIVKCIIFNAKLKKILLVKRSHTDPTGADTWENAGGNMEHGEQPEDAARREVWEETGISDIIIKRVAYVTLVNGENPYLIIAYLCETKTENVTLSPEHREFIWADSDECRKLLPKSIEDDFEKHGIFELFLANSGQ